MSKVSDVLALMMFLAALVVLLTGCATMINGIDQEVALRSHPPGAMVRVSNIEAQTPTTMTFKRIDDYKAVFTMEGYPARSTMIRSEASLWLFGNILFGFLGLIFDLASGGGFEFPDVVEMDLVTGMVSNGEAPAQHVSSPPNR